MKKSIEFIRMRDKCLRATGGSYLGYSGSETERISTDKKVCGTIEEGTDLLDIRVMAQHDNELSYWQETVVKDILGYAVTRLARVLPFKNVDNGMLDIKNLPKDTPKINAWEKKQNRSLLKWVKHYTEKVRQVVMKWNTSQDGRTESFLSYKDGFMHIHTITQIPDFDIPENGETEIIGLMAKFNREVNEIVNARLEFWREEERNGRI